MHQYLLLPIPPNLHVCPACRRQYECIGHRPESGTNGLRPCESSIDSGWKEIPKSGVKAICHFAVIMESEESSIRLVDQLGVSPQRIPEAFFCPTALGIGHMEKLTNAELRKSQEEDPVISEMWSLGKYLPLIRVPMLPLLCYSIKNDPEPTSPLCHHKFMWKRNEATCLT